MVIPHESNIHPTCDSCAPYTVEMLQVARRVKGDWFFAASRCRHRIKVMASMDCGDGKHSAPVEFGSVRGSPAHSPQFDLEFGIRR